MKYLFRLTRFFSLGFALMTVAACSGGSGSPGGSAPDGGTPTPEAGGIEPIEASTGPDGSNSLGNGTPHDSGGGSPIDSGSKAPTPKGTLRWAHSFGQAPPASVGASATQAAFGSADEVVLAGSFVKSIQSMGGPQTTPGWGVFLGSATASGVAVSATTNTSNDADGAFVLPDHAGNTYFVFRYSGAPASVHSGSSATTTSLTPTGSRPGGGWLFADALVKFNASGGVAASLSIGADAQSSIEFVGMAFAPNGNIILTGSFQNTLTLGANPATVLTSNGDEDIFVIELDLSLNVVTAKSYGGTGSDQPSAIAVDATGNVILAGNTFSPEITFCTNSGSTPAGAETFVTSLNLAMGTCNFTTGYANTGVNGLALDPSGHAVLGGSLRAGATFGGYIPTAKAPTEEGAYLLSLDGSGAIQWLNPYTSVNIWSVAVDHWGEVVAGGYFSGTVNFGGSPITAAQRDGFVIKLTSAGALLWSTTFGDASGDIVNGVAVDGSGNIAAVGAVEGTSSVSSAGGANATTVGTAGGTQALVFELSP
jgi:hypothetical protein